MRVLGHMETDLDIFILVCVCVFMFACVLDGVESQQSDRYIFKQMRSKRTKAKAFLSSLQGQSWSLSYWCVFFHYSRFPMCIDGERYFNEFWLNSGCVQLFDNEEQSVFLFSSSSTIVLLCSFWTSRPENLTNCFHSVIYIQIQSKSNHIQSFKKKGFIVCTLCGSKNTNV